MSHVSDIRTPPAFATQDPSAAGEPVYALARRLWHINRSISGPGLRETLGILRGLLPKLRLIEIPSGDRVLDWIVPEEWEITSGWLEGPDGERVVDFADNNLHIVGYSQAVDSTMELSELQQHLYSLPDQPDAVPYVTSYYAPTWGFCLSERQRQSLRPGMYRARIDASHFAGSITLADLVIPGESSREVLLSSYCCHPSMANNELSGPCVLAHLARWIAERPSRRWTYRIVFVPEMIGSIAYLHHHIDILKSATIAGFNLTCLGDERAWSLLPSRHGGTLSDRIARHVLRHEAPTFTEYGWKDRGSDESNYCAPGIDLPVASVMRSKYGTYPEYHTSLDTLDGVVTATGLGQSLLFYQSLIETLEHHCRPVSLVLGEPQLGRRGLYPSLSRKGSSAPARVFLDILSLADGAHSLLDIAERCDRRVSDLFEPLRILETEGLIRLESTEEG